MNCEYCQTWILDDDHRCSRCGRRVRSSRGAYPASKSATARVQDLDTLEQRSGPAVPQADTAGQQALFNNPNPSRLVAFESLTSPEERASIRARAAGMASQEAPKRARVELRRARPARGSAGQQRLDFFGQEEVLTPPQSHIICDAPVAPIALRIEAALIDAAITLFPSVIGLVLSYRGWPPVVQQACTAVLVVGVLYGASALQIALDRCRPRFYRDVVCRASAGRFRW